MILYGAGGHAKVVLDILQAIGVQVSSLFDDNSSLSELHGLRVVLPHDTMEKVICCVGDNGCRKQLVETHAYQYGQAIHPLAVISPSAQIGKGTVVMPGAIIQADAVIGNHCIINSGAIVEHDCRVGDYAHVSPGATLCGQVHLGEGAWIGAGATIIPCVHVGDWSVVGAGATVVKTVPSKVVVVGCPAKFFREVVK